MSTMHLKSYLLHIFDCAFKKVYNDSYEFVITVPPQINMGDFSIPVFSFANNIEQSPAEVAKKIAKEIKEDTIIKKVVAAGPYINFYISNQYLFGMLIEEIALNFNIANTELNGKNLMVEYLSPNTNKPLHLGHVRNGVLGMAMSKILQAVGYNVIKSNLINDRGIHICKSMIAWLRWGNNSTPAEAGIKGDHFVGDFYVKFEKELQSQIDALKIEIYEEHLQKGNVLELEKIKVDPNEAQIMKDANLMLKQWEEGNEEVHLLWQKMNQWVYQGFDETYLAYGFEFDCFYHESQTYLLGKDIIEKGLKKKVFQLDEKGNTIYVLPEKEFGLEKDGSQRKVTLLRPNATSLYITQDLGTALKKFNDYDLSKSVYVVGSEQVDHFKRLFEILRAIGFEKAEGCYHLSYGMVYLPEGKMKSREGKVIDADDLLADMTEMAAQAVLEREPDLDCHEARRRGRAIALGAIKFYLLKVSANSAIYFDPNESLSLEGCTGPYCQYAYVRAMSVMQKAVDKGIKGSDYALLGQNEEEKQLARQLIGLGQAIIDSAKEMNPVKTVTAVFDLAKAFNQFYEKHKIVDEDNVQLSAARVDLVKTVALNLKYALTLLGIPVIERM